MKTLPLRRRNVTHKKPESARRHLAVVRSVEERRAGLALRATLTIAGLGAKQAALALDRHRTTVQRYQSGEIPTPASKLRDSNRKLAESGAFPAPIIADLLADAWDSRVRGLATVDDIRASRAAAHRREQERQGQVDVWQMDDLLESGDCGDAVAENILAQVSHLLEIYALIMEERIRC